MISTEQLREDEEQIRRLLKESEESRTALLKLLQEQQKAQNAVRKSSIEIEDLYNHAPCGYHSLDPEGRYIRINDTELQWLGYTREELVGKKRFDDLITANSLQLFHKHFPIFKERGWVKDLEFEMVRKDGSVLPVLLSATAVLDDTGRFLISRSTVFDITERKRAEEALRRLNRKLRTISNCNQVLMRATSEEELLNAICRVVCEDADYRMAWVGYVEHDQAQTVHPVAWTGVENGYLETANVVWSDSDRGRGPTGTAIRTGHTVSIEDFSTDSAVTPWREQALQRGYHSSIALPLKDENGGVLGAFTIYSGEPNAFIPEEILLMEELADNLAFGISVQRDRIKRKRAEEEIRTLNAELEERVHQRTVQLEASNKELQAFSHSVSHDLRAPLRHVDAFSKVLLENYEDKLDEEGKDCILRVRAAGQRMGRLIDDLLNLSRVSRAELQRENINLSNMVEIILAELKERKREHQVTSEVAPDLKCAGDPGFVRIALENLLENAWKFTGHCPDPKIEFGSINEQNRQVFFVRDNGAGFDMKYVGKLFGTFQRLHTDAEFTGTGIGLATVQRIINRHGGEIWAEGAVGRGATFYFTLT